MVVELVQRRAMPVDCLEIGLRRRHLNIVVGWYVEGPVDADPEIDAGRLDQRLERGSIKSTNNAYVESFNGRFRDECLNTHWFLSLEDAQSKIEAWRRDFNETRPHTSSGFMTPAEFASSVGVNPSR